MAFTWAITNVITDSETLNLQVFDLYGAPGVDQTKGRCPTEELEAPEYKLLQPYQ